jgi:hypothetical protein
MKIQKGLPVIDSRRLIERSNAASETPHNIDTRGIDDMPKNNTKRIIDARRVRRGASKR